MSFKLVLYFNNYKAVGSLTNNREPFAGSQAGKEGPSLVSPSVCASAFPNLCSPKAMEMQSLQA